MKIYLFSEKRTIFFFKNPDSGYQDTILFLALLLLRLHVVFYIRNHFIRKSASKSQKIKKKSKKLGRLRYKYP